MSAVGRKIEKSQAAGGRCSAVAGTELPPRRRSERKGGTKVPPWKSISEAGTTKRIASDRLQGIVHAAHITVSTIHTYNRHSYFIILLTSIF